MRREFLKIIGASGLGLTLGSLAAFTFLKEGKLSNHASAQSYGSWQLGGETHVTPIHSAMLYNGKILYVAGSGFYSETELGPFSQGIYDPVTDTAQPAGQGTSFPSSGPRDLKSIAFWLKRCRYIGSSILNDAPAPSLL
jgi:hypothetical protein